MDGDMLHGSDGRFSVFCVYREDTAVGYNPTRNPENSKSQYHRLEYANRTPFAFLS